MNISTLTSHAKEIRDRAPAFDQHDVKRAVIEVVWQYLAEDGAKEAIDLFDDALRRAQR